MKSKYDSEDPVFQNLESFQSLNSEQDWKNVRERIGFEKSRPSQTTDMAGILRIAAIFLLLIGIGFLSQHYLFTPPEQILARAEDGPLEVLLADGTRVTLNHGAELSYPEKFRVMKREVLLKGEAFFEVERNPRKPFLVSIEKKATVEVLGTSFNIRSDSQSGSIQVLVVEGRVAFSDAVHKIPPLILGKNEQAVLKDGSINRENVTDRNMLSWKTGILSFDQSFIGDVVQALSAYYNREISLEEDVPEDLQFTSTIENQDLECVLEEITMVLGLTVSYDDDKVLILKSH